MADILVRVLAILMFCAVGVIFILLAKNDNTFKNHNIITNTIFNYRMHCIHSIITPEVDWSDMENYNKTFWRLWDWGYKRILPADKFEIIEPFID